MTKTINIIGSGNVGQTLGRLFVDSGLAKIYGVYNRDERKANLAIDFIGQGTFHADILNLPHADITFITTSDDYIEKAANILQYNENIQPDDIVVHCSGVLSSDCMRSLKDKGCLLASAHPMKSFIDPKQSSIDYSGTYCAIEGDCKAIEVLQNVFFKIGFIVFKLNKDKKPLYHASGVFASNYLLTLSKQALECLEEACVEKEVAVSIVVSLMQSTINNLANTRSPKDALTGPIKRGDIATIEKHLSAFSDSRKRKLYETLFEATKDTFAIF